MMSKTYLYISTFEDVKRTTDIDVTLTGGVVV